MLSFINHQSQRPLLVLRRVPKAVRRALGQDRRVEVGASPSALQRALLHCRIGAVQAGHEHGGDRFVFGLGQDAERGG